jgi:glycosyltransferase involved in cell wall biosynthesis
MKVLNLGETTVFLDDINVYIQYDKYKRPVEIAPAIASGSRKLHAAIKQGLLLDVSNGVPDVLPLAKSSKLSNIKPTIFSQAHDAIRYFKEDGSLCVVWTGPAADASGYANLNRRFMFGLDSSRVLVKYVPLNSYWNAGPDVVNNLMGLQLNSALKNSPVVYGMPAPVCEDSARHRIFLTMMETSRLHEDYVERCNAANEVVVPTRWCKDVFESSGVTKPVHVVPIGVDCSAYRPGLDPLRFFNGHRPFTFLSVFQWSLRKGYDVLIKAFSEEFVKGDDVALVISSKMYGESDDCKSQLIKNEIKRLAAESGNPSRAPIVYFGDTISDEVMPRLYSAADCFVLPSRGEGFGLPYVEAAACGVPVIGTRYSGQTDFLTDENSYLVDVDSLARAPDLEVVSRFFQGMEFPVLGRSAIDQTRLHMRRVYENREEAKNKARNLRAEVEQKYDWPVCVGQMREKLIETFRLL